jgi:DNA-binding MarR family transcriptional regulator
VDNELDLLLGTAIDSLLKLDVLLYLQSRPGSVQSSQDIAAQVRRPPYQVSASLDELSQAGLVDRFALGTGRHVLYGPTEDEHVQEIIDLLHERYRDPETRPRIVRGATISPPQADA